MKTTIKNRNKSFKEDMETGQLSKRRKQVKAAIKKYGKLTSDGVCKKTKLPINTVSGRLHELENLGEIEVCGSTRGISTGRLRSVYQIYKNKSKMGKTIISERLKNSKMKLAERLYEHSQDWIFADRKAYINSLYKELTKK